MKLHTLNDVSSHQAEVHPHAVAMTFGDRRTSFLEVDKLANMFANGLLAAGVQAEDRIAYLGKNSDMFFVALFGAARIGAVLTPINWRLSPDEVDYVLSDSDAAALFLDDNLDPRLETLKSAASLKLRISLGDHHPRWPVFRDWVNRQSASKPTHVVTADSPALQLYTSGTTGYPKGAVLAHQAILNVFSLKGPGLEWNEWQPDDVSLLIVPQFHIGGVSWGLGGFCNGVETNILREFDPAAVLAAIENAKVTRFFAVPAMLQVLLARPEAKGVDCRRLRHIVYGASPIAPAVLHESMRVFGCAFAQVYGMTETSGAITSLGSNDHAGGDPNRLGSAGKALPGVAFKIVGTDGKVPAGAMGEIATRSIQNMCCYWKKPDATKSTIDEDGWLFTGDVGFIDPDGYLFIYDRVKDMIISGGENIYPAEVEKVLSEHHGVADVAVFGIPDDAWGESVKAAVVPKPGSALEVDDLIAWTRTKIAGYKVPKTIEVVATLPRNAAGKVLRRQLREPYWKSRSRAVN